jgi:hypothetical protein
MRNYGIGSYVITVTAIGDGPTWLDSSESAQSAAQTVTRRTGVQYVWWFGTEARWVNTDTSGDYVVQLYKANTSTGDFEAAGSEASVTRESTDNGNDETRTAYDFSTQITTSGSGVYTFKVKALGDTYLILDAEYIDFVSSAIYATSPLEMVKYKWNKEESSAEMYDDDSLSTNFAIPTGKTLVIKAGKTLTIDASAELSAGNLKLGPGTWKATNADVTITADTLTLGNNTAPGFGAADGSAAAVLTGGEAGTNTFTASGGTITLGQSGTSLSVTGSSASATLTLGTTARFYVSENTTLGINGGAVVSLIGGAKIEVAKDGTIEIGTNSKIAAGDYLDLTAGTWKATGGISYEWDSTTHNDTGVYISGNRIDLGDSRQNKFGKDNGTAATTFAGPFENKWSAGSSYVASGAKVTVGQNGNSLVFTGADSAAMLTLGVSAGIWVKAGLTIDSVVVDMNKNNDYESVIYLDDVTTGITLSNADSKIIFNEEATAGGAYDVGDTLTNEISVTEFGGIRGVWNDAWKNESNSWNNNRFASFSGIVGGRVIKATSGTLWLTQKTPITY